MLITAGLLLAIGAQFAAGAINHKRTSKQMEKLQALQHDFEESVQRDGIERAWDKFNQLCSIQKEIEAEVHQYRLNNIEDSFRNYLEVEAYAQALENWPLRVLPFVMKDESLCKMGQQSEHTKIALHCLLTRGNDEKFHIAIHRELEYSLSQYFNQYWNASSSHPILFYSGAWKEMYDASRVVDNLYNQLEKLPTLVITPWITENDEFFLKVSIWGIPGVERENTKYIPNSITHRYKQKQKIYTKEEKAQILNELCPRLEAFISYIADQYYWNYNKMPPLLPSLLAKGVVSVNGNQLVEEYREHYLEMFNKYVVENIGVHCLDILARPESSLELFENISSIMTADKTKKMLEDSLRALCKSRKTDINNKSVADLLLLDVYNRFDTCYLNKLANLGKFVFQEAIIAKTKTIEKYHSVPHLCNFKNIECVNWMEFLYIISKEKYHYEDPIYFGFHMLTNQILVGTFADKIDNLLFYEKKTNTHIYTITLYKPLNNLKNSDCFYRFDLTKGITHESSKENQFEKKLYEITSKNINLSTCQLILEKQIKLLEQNNTVFENILPDIVNNIGSEKVSTYCFSDIVRWAKQNYKTGNQLYMIKGFYNKINCYVVCAFFALDDNPLLDVKDCKICFLSYAIPEEIQKRFGDKKIYISPIKNIVN